jgi:hypothetical protein
MKTAILIDGGFYRKRAKTQWGKKKKKNYQQRIRYHKLNTCILLSNKL